MYHSQGRSNLVRQYSCGRIYRNGSDDRELDISDVLHIDRNRSNDEIRPMEFYSESIESYNWQFGKSNKILQAPKFVPTKRFNVEKSDNVENRKTTMESEGISCSGSTEMKVDKDKNNQPASIKPENNKKGTYEDVKKKFRSLVVQRKNSTKRKTNTYIGPLLTLCVIPMMTMLLLPLINLNMYKICNRIVFFSNSSNDLHEKIYGQDKAISSIVSSLNYDAFYLKVLCLIGGTGVGKSYVGDIIIKNYPWQNKIFLYDVALKHQVDDLKALNSSDKYELLVVENLKMRHLELFSKMIDIIANTNKCLTVMAIFNVEEVNDSLERTVNLEKSTDVILQAMTNKKIDISIVPFQSLSEQALEMCIREAAMNSGVQPTWDQINEVKQALMSSGSGCKGAYAKLQVFGI